MNVRMIIDKSLFQLMPPQVFTPLDRHFEVLIPTILVREILGDLANPKAKDAKAQAANLANRFGINTLVLPHYRDLVFHSLAGKEPPMDGKAVVAGMRPVRTVTGKTGHVIERTTEDSLIDRCQTSSFSVEDQLWATKWQSRRVFVRQKLYLRKLDEAGMTVPKPRNLVELKQVVDSIMENRGAQGKLLNLIFQEAGIPLTLQGQTITRWFKRGRTLLIDFAPYAAYFIRANLFLAIGNLNESVLGKQDDHDLRDLEYCYYLPFCEVFASNDRMQRKLINLLKRSEQTLIGSELCDDLSRLADDWYSLTPGEKIAQHFTHGFRPPPHAGSIALKLWDLYRPNYDPSKFIVPKQGGELHRGLKAKFDEIKKAEATTATIGTSGFLRRERPVSDAKLRELHPHAEF